MQETQVQSLGQEDPLEKKMATHSSILAWRIPWMEEPGRLQSMGSQRVRHDFIFQEFKETRGKISVVLKGLELSWWRLGINQEMPQAHQQKRSFLLFSAVASGTVAFLQVYSKMWSMLTGGWKPILMRSCLPCPKGLRSESDLHQQ